MLNVPKCVTTDLVPITRTNFRVCFRIITIQWRGALLSLREEVAQPARITGGS